LDALSVGASPRRAAASRIDRQTPSEWPCVASSRSILFVSRPFIAESWIASVVIEFFILLFVFAGIVCPRLLLFFPPYCQPRQGYSSDNAPTVRQTDHWLLFIFRTGVSVRVSRSPYWTGCCRHSDCWRARTAPTSSSHGIPMRPTVSSRAQSGPPSPPFGTCRDRPAPGLCPKIRPKAAMGYSSGLVSLRERPALSWCF